MPAKRTVNSDPETKAITTILGVLEPLSPAVQSRVLGYVSSRTVPSAIDDTDELVIACTKAFESINEAARVLSQGPGEITTPQLVAAVLRIYDVAVGSASETT